MALTAKQEAFAQAVASGKNYSEAYRRHYNVSPDTLPSSVWDTAWKTATHPEVSQRIEALRLASQERFVEQQAWTLQKITDEAATNMRLAREHKQIASANGALEIIGRSTGLLTEKTRENSVQVTSITVRLAPNVQDSQQPQVIEGSTRELPEAEES